MILIGYFNRKPEYVWSNVVDREFMELLPDIIGRPHVHVDPVILVIYYCILYNEFALNSGPISLSTDGSEYLNVCYLGCLRALQAWQREACGSLADFVAAISVVSYHFTQIPKGSLPSLTEFHRPKWLPNASTLTCHGRCSSSPANTAKASTSTIWTRTPKTCSKNPSKWTESRSRCVINDERTFGNS